MTPAEALDQAADIIERSGLWKGRNGGVLGGECVFTALGKVDSSVLSPAIEILSKRTGNVTKWNDDPATSDDDVIETLRKVAAEARWTEGIE